MELKDTSGPTTVGGRAFGEVIAAIASGKRATAASLLGGHSRAYYTSGNSELTDPEFDAAVVAFKGRFGSEFMPARTDRQTSTQQTYPFLATFIDQELHSKKELVAWIKKNSLGDSTVVMGSPKYDGQSLTIPYSQDGYVLSATTRGDDGFGVDVSRLFAGERHYDVALGVPFGVKYEVVMRWADVDALSEATGKTYKNPRNTVPGLLSSDDSRSKRDYITLVPLDIEFEGMLVSRVGRIEFFDTNLLPYFTGNGARPTPWEWGIATTGTAGLYVDAVVALRSQPDYDYMLDGVVIELASAEDIANLGGRSSRPRWMAKYKFPPMVARTRAVSLDWDVGNTGRLTPVVNFEPVVLNRNTYIRTSIANVARFDQLQLRPGSPLIFELRHEVLGWLDRAEGEPEPEGVEPFAGPPEGAQFTYNDEGQRVFAYAPAPLAGRCERAMVKFGVKGVRIQQLTKLCEAGLVQRLGDVFRLDPERVAEVPTFGAASAGLLCSAVDAEARPPGGVWDWKVLASLGIVGIGRTLSKAALRVCTLEDILREATAPPSAMLAAAAPGDLTSRAANLLLGGTDTTGSTYDGTSQLTNMHVIIRPPAADFGPERALTLLAGVRQYADDLRDLMETLLVKQTMVFAEPSGVQVTTNVTIPAPLAGDASIPISPPSRSYRVVVTGDLEGWERETFKEAAEALGHKVVGAISKKVDFLITNFPNSGTNKVRDAQALGLPVHGEEEATQLLGLPWPGPKASRPGAPGPLRQTNLDDL